MCHMSRVMCQVSHFLQSGEASYNNSIEAQAWEASKAMCLLLLGQQREQ